MEEPLCQTFKIGLLLSKSNILMSEAEAIESCKIYFEITSSERQDNLLILNIKQNNPNKNNKQSFQELFLWLNRLALTKEAHIIIGNTTNSPILNQNIIPSSSLISNITNNTLNPTFKISTRNVNISEGNHKNFNLETFAKLLAEREFHKTNMHSPNLEFTILYSTKTFLCIKIWTNNDSFEERKAHLRPVLHPTAMNPRLARAMINMAGAEKEIFDPFCGAGGILLEAALINLKATGTDLDQTMIQRATINLEEVQSKHPQQISIKEHNALTWDKTSDCVVTDLPYGKSSKLENSLSQLIPSFLTHYANLTNKVVFCFPKTTTPIIPAPWIIKYMFEIYIHKSLTRCILVLEKQKNVKIQKK